MLCTFCSIIILLQANKIWIHPNYNQTAYAYENNVALLQLATPLNLSDGIDAISFDVQEVATEMMDCVLVGWGEMNGTCNIVCQQYLTSIFEF